MKLKTSLKVSGPREHSELLVKVAEKIANERNYSTVLDMGTGTGYIALALNNSGLKASGCDISSHSVDLAKENCQGRDIDIFQSDLFSNVKNKYDIILFNPPASGKGGESVLSNFIRGTILRKPLSALFYRISAKGRLALINKFLTEAPNFLNKSGIVLVYLNPNEVEMMKTRFRKIFNISTIGHRKMSNDLRIMIGELN